MTRTDSTAELEVAPLAQLPLTQRLRRVFSGFLGMTLLLFGTQLGVLWWRDRHTPRATSLGWASTLAAELLAVALGAVLFAVFVRYTQTRWGRMWTGMVTMLPLALHVGLMTVDPSTGSVRVGADPAAVALLVGGAVIGLAVRRVA